MPSIRTFAEWNPPTPPDLPKLRQALATVMQTAVDFARALWYQRAQDLGIRATGSYLQGIQDAEVRVVSERFDGTEIELVYELVNHSPHASIVENGHPAFSLPQHIDWNDFSGRIKRGKNGPYLHIPFRHAAFQSDAARERSGMTVSTLKTMMPPEVYARAKRLTRTLALKQGPITRAYTGTTSPSNAASFIGGVGWVAQDRTGAGHTVIRQHVAADRYQRGTRLRDTGTGIVAGAAGLTEYQRGPRPVLGRTATGGRLFNPAWQSSRFEGMMKTGPKGHTEYLTVRTITPDSPGWNIPARMGTGCARQVAAALNGGIGHERFSDLLVQTAVAAVTGRAP